MSRKECPICIDELREKNTFHCFSCKIDCCIKCMKTYLLGSSKEPHCMGCRTVINYDTFIEKFDKTWRLGQYKTHKEKILWDVEQSQLPATVGYMELLEKREEMRKEYRKHYDMYTTFSYKISANKYQKLYMEEEIKNYEKIKSEAYKEYNRYYQEYSQYDEMIRNKKKRSKYNWTQACPTSDCKGFLNDKYECPICNKKYCKDCLEEKKSKEHECNEELKETLKLIRKESKPCPSCGEFIGKVSGCDQMFCTSCGSAFSWATGQIERGVIHNPHAHDFFQRNPEALQEYQRNRQNTGGGGVGGGGIEGNPCRDIVPGHIDYISIYNSIHNDLYKKLIENSIDNDVYREFEAVLINRLGKMEKMRVNLAEYYQYRRNPITEKIFEESDYISLRMKFLKKELDEKKFKSLLHMKSKRIQFQKLVHELCVSSVQIWGGLIWSIKDAKNIEDFLRLYDMIEDVRKSTNDMILSLKEKHNYQSRLEVDDLLKIPPYA